MSKRSRQDSEEILEGLVDWTIRLMSITLGGMAGFVALLVLLKWLGVTP